MESERESDGSQTGIKLKSRWESDEDWTEIKTGVIRGLNGN